MERNHNRHSNLDQDRGRPHDHAQGHVVDQDLGHRQYQGQDLDRETEAEIKMI